jgi:NAD kinase
MGAQRSCPLRKDNLRARRISEGRNSMYEKIVFVTRKTRLQELIERFNTKAQARFYIEHSGANFSEYEEEDAEYQRALDRISTAIDSTLNTQFIDRKFVPNFVFSAKDIVVALGQDGLVANVAKYAGAQPIIGVNPDPKRIDGVLVPVPVAQLSCAVDAIATDKAQMSLVTLAEVKTNDGQRLLAFNDLFIGAQTHISARYQLTYSSKSEEQSSSGIIVSTGAGSTGWLSSMFNMMAGLAAFSGSSSSAPIEMQWGTPELIFVVREPFASKHSQTGIVAGYIDTAKSLRIESRMPSAGTIFSDGVESDFISFTSGMIATIRPAAEQARLYNPAKNNITLAKAQGTPSPAFLPPVTRDKSNLFKR